MSQTAPPFDPDALRRKYLEERDKRLQAGSDRGFIETSGAYEEFVSDPYAPTQVVREAERRDVDVLIVGAGYSGLHLGAWLKQEQISDFLILDRASDFGGTWYWNRYPGVACDVEAYIYMPFLEALEYVPTQKYARGQEIWDHTRAVGRHFGLYEHARFQTGVTDAIWNEAERRWVLTTDRGDVYRARFMVMATGSISRPKLPSIPGINTFRGPAFHTSRWDFDYTGGDTDGDLTHLADKRVGLIGTGASAVQCVPYLGESAGELFVFQRTPSTVDVRANRATDLAWAETLRAGWQDKRMENFDAIISGLPQEEDLVSDNWTDIWRNLVILGQGAEDTRGDAQSIEDRMQLADYTKMEQIRQRVSDTVTDPKTAEALKPYYNMFCKRPCFNDEYLPTFNRPNVHLIDTMGKGVERITESAIVANGRSYEVDCIIFGTGFEVLGSSYRAGGFEIRGVGGRTLADKWGGGVRSLHGMYTHGFPNFFIVGTIEGGTATVNAPLTIGRQTQHAAKVIGQLLHQDAERAEVTQAAEDGWVQLFEQKAISRAKFLAECTPGYYNNEGRVDRSLFSGLYGGGPFEYFKIISDWRSDGLEQDMKIERGASKTAV